MDWGVNQHLLSGIKNVLIMISSKYALEQILFKFILSSLHVFVSQMYTIFNEAC